jgi:type VI secretion system secreted protein VgrG
LSSTVASVLGGLNQQGRLLKLDTPLSGVTLTPIRAVGESRIGRQYEFVIDAVSSREDIPLKTLIAQSVTLWIQQSDQTYLPHHGYVHTVRRLGSNGSLSTYQIAFKSWIHFLKFRKDARIWQNKSVDDILNDVFNAHQQAQGAFTFSLSNALPKRSFCVQYEDDWTFAHRIMEQEGLFGFFKQASDGKSHTLVVTDNLYALPENPQQTIGFYRAGMGSEADAFTQWGGTRELQSAQLTTRTYDYKQPSGGVFGKGTDTPTMANQGNLPSQAEVYEYTGAYTYNAQDRGDSLSEIRMQEWESRAKRFYGAGGSRSVDAGQWFALNDHPVHQAGSTQDRQFAVIETRWVIENNVSVSSESADFPFSLKAHVDKVRSAHQAQSGATHMLAGTVASAVGLGRAGTSNAGGGTAGFYMVEVEAQRRSVPFRSPLEHLKPRMTMQTATVVGPSGQEVYTDSLNRIKVRFHWDRLNDGDENASCWVRVMQSDSGNGYGGVHSPRIGEEVIVAWLDDDCDRPLVTGRLYNGKTTPQWHSNGILSGFKSKEYGGSGYNQLVMDDATGQNRVQLASSTATSALHLGYLVNHTGNTRGEYLGTGFDLVSCAYGALRARQGMYISTHPTTAQPMDASNASQQLINAESVMEALSQASTTAQAAGLDDGHTALKQFTDATQNSASGLTQAGGNTAGGGTGNANQFTDPVLLMASPSGIGMATQASLHLSATKQVNVVSGQDTSFAVGKSLIAAVKEKISLFAQNAGIKLFAAKGPVQIQAQSDAIEVTAQKGVKVLSATDVIQISAAKGVLLTSGGAYIKIADGNIQIHAPATVDVKGGAHDFSGPTRLDTTFPTWNPVDDKPPPRSTSFSG